MHFFVCAKFAFNNAIPHIYGLEMIMALNVNFMHAKSSYLKPQNSPSILFKISLLHIYSYHMH